jgi:hypothetical protein
MCHDLFCYVQSKFYSHNQAVVDIPNDIGLNVFAVRILLRLEREGPEDGGDIYEQRVVGDMPSNAKPVDSPSEMIGRY